MVQVKYVFGFVFLGAAIWMAERILPSQVGMALWAILLLTAAVFLGLADRLDANASAEARLRKAAGLAFFLGGVMIAIGAASGGTDPLRPLAHFGMGGSERQFAEAEVRFVEARSTPEVQQAIASAEGRPTLVYFTADWCVTCKTIERNVLPQKEIMAGLDGFQRIKVDLTKLDEANQALMRDLAVIGPPTMIFFDRNAAEADGSRLVGDVTTDTLRASIALTEP